MVRLRFQVNPRRGLTWSDCGATSLRTPNSVAMAGLYSGVSVKRFPSSRSPYMSCHAGLMRQRSLAAANAFHSPPVRRGEFSVRENDDGALFWKSTMEL